MRKLFPGYAVCVLMIFVSAAAARTEKQPVDYVRPDIGGVSLLLKTTRPLVLLPHGYPQVTPLLNPGLADSYLATKIYGFPAGGAVLMPATGELKTKPGTLASNFDRALETRTPYYYQGLLSDDNIEASYTVGHFAIFYRFQFLSPGRRHVSIMMNSRGLVRKVSATLVEGSTTIHGVPYYFYLEFSKPSANAASWQYGGPPHPARQIEGQRVGLTLNFADSGSQWVDVKAGLSFISLAQAKKNLNEAIQGWNFALRKQQTKAAWNNLLGKIDVEGGTEKQKIIFYSSLYRAEQEMMDITEDGRYFSGFDHKVHETNGVDFYTSGQFWDTFRCEHPLQLLLNPRQQEAIVQSLLRMHRQWGWLPSFPRVWGEFPVMTGSHSDEFIADTYFKGYRKFNAEEAYQAMKHQALHATLLPWRRGPMTYLGKTYLEKGFFPALKEGEKEPDPYVHPFERRQAVSVTLGAAYDDWCVARMAQALGHQKDYERFIKMAHNYEKVFNKSIGFMAPRSADGQWVKGFNPILPRGPGGRDYFTEGNAWVWTFFVPHDPAGLIRLFGGRQAFLHKLDQLFVEQYGGLPKFKFLAKFPDMTGLIGNYAAGNEPSFDIAYLYDFAGQPWKSAKMVREIMQVWYNDTPLGLPGDDDHGAMGAWYAFSAMGFYPFCPGAPYYVVGSPLFRKTTIHLPGGGTFTIRAEGVSKRNQYIQSATLNGKPLAKPWFTQKAIRAGGSLDLHMGPLPNKNWGSAPSDAPPSMSGQP